MFCFMLEPFPVWAGQTFTPSLDCAGSNAAWESQGIPCRCVNGQVVCDQPSGGHNHGVTSGDVKAMVVGTIFESLLTSLFTDDTATSQKEAQAAQQKAAALAAQQAAMNREKEREAQAAYEKMMRSYKQLDDSQGVAFKTLSDSALTFKTLDGNAETLAANARKPFDTAGSAPSSATTSGQATPFFGDSMPIKDIRLLVNPENDPRVVDLREAHSFMVKNLKSRKEMEGNGKPIVKSPDCVKLRKKMDGFITQQNKFYKTVNLAQDQLNIWENQNRNALIHAAKDGIEYLTGKWLRTLAKEGEFADHLEEVYEKNAAQMARDGLDVTAIKATIQRLKQVASTGKFADLTGNIKESQTFIKDGMSTLLAQLSSANHDVQEMLEDPKMGKYFETDLPEMRTACDVAKLVAASKIFAKWGAEKIPIVAAAELSVNETYDGLDFFLSFKRMTEANKINGRVLEAARYLQRKIDDTHLELQECRQ